MEDGLQGDTSHDKPSITEPSRTRFLGLFIVTTLLQGGHLDLRSIIHRSLSTI
ncbi:hypothetical protein J6590_088655 [Homalodisca vitripennis]|nr:hypothetical protein J6590_088655 [Homalodisca vitripennis]